MMQTMTQYSQASGGGGGSVGVLAKVVEAVKSAGEMAIGFGNRAARGLGGVPQRVGDAWSQAMAADRKYTAQALRMMERGEIR